MSVKEELHEFIDHLPEKQAENLLRFLKDDDSPTALLVRMGPWEDDRSTEEIIRDIYDSRTSSDRVIEL